MHTHTHTQAHTQTYTHTSRLSHTPTYIHTPTHAHGAPRADINNTHTFVDHTHMLMYNFYTHTQPHTHTCPLKATVYVLVAVVSKLT